MSGKPADLDLICSYKTKTVLPKNSYCQSRQSHSWKLKLEMIIMT